MGTHSVGRSVVGSKSRVGHALYVTSILSSSLGFRSRHNVRARALCVERFAMGADKRKKDDDNAAAIAEKLLQGWTMLAEYCPMEGVSRAAHALSRRAQVLRRARHVRHVPRGGGRHEGERRRRGGSLGRVPRAETRAGRGGGGGARVGGARVGGAHRFLPAAPSRHPLVSIRGRRAPGELQRPRGRARRRRHGRRHRQDHRAGDGKHPGAQDGGGARGWQTPRSHPAISNPSSRPSSASRPPSKRARASDDTGDDPRRRDETRAERYAQHRSSEWKRNESNRQSSARRNHRHEAPTESSIGANASRRLAHARFGALVAFALSTARASVVVTRGTSTPRRRL